MTAFRTVGAAALAICLHAATAQGPSPQDRTPPALAPLATLPARDVVHPAIACRQLASRDFSATANAPFQVVSAREESEPGGSVCRVQAMVAPQVRFQLDMPLEGYRGRYLQAGCGGNCGFITTRLVPPCANAQVGPGGFAVAASDSGHSGRGEAWAADPQLRTDFAYRADHVTSLAAQALLSTFYGVPPAFRYFAGCSDGGREALEEAQRYPDDFNGILAGSPAIRIAEAMEQFLWLARKSVNPDDSPVFDRPAVTLLHNAVLKACDALDGVEDGQIDDPRRCHFDPSALLCSGDPMPGACLTGAQVQAAKDFYSGPLDDHGRRLSWGGQPYGSELNWATSQAMNRELASGFITWMVYGGHPPRDMDVDHWSFNAASLHKLATDGAIFDSRNPDLTTFRDRGGKLILWQGFADAAAGEYSTLAYYQAMRDRMGGMDAVRRFARTFMIPAGYHCMGGYIAYDEDLLGALINWVEVHETPERVVARATLPGGVPRTRPLFAYPARAVYTGSGDINLAESFRGNNPAQEPDDHYEWLGAGEP